LRSREQRSGKLDHIPAIIQTSNQIAVWVIDSILRKEDSKKRAGIMKHFIQVADKCRQLQNFSTMLAIVSGLGSPSIRRLKRTWEQVNQRTTSQLEVCEYMMDSGKNFNNYRQTLTKVSPPCVPFFGVYLTQLTFIQDGNPDNIEGDLINFSKRHKAAEVINDIKRWQARHYNLQPVPSLLGFIEDCLNQYTGSEQSLTDEFWHLSLEREPREREDEKMARLLQESGFL
jgi:son of sevenless-like protein